MKAVIIEDERLVAEEMKSAIQQVAPHVDVICVLPSLKQARTWLDNNALPDFFFMDIKLADGISFELFDTHKITVPVIFCTAYEEYAVRAFKVSGVDYLLKPVQEEELAIAIEKVSVIYKEKVQVIPDIKVLIDQFKTAADKKNQYRERFIVNSHNKWTPVETQDIAMIQRETLNYLYRFNGDKLIYDYTPMEEIEEVLDPGIFFRANRQTIINIKAIHTVKPLSNQKVLVYLHPPFKDPIDVSREKAPLLRKWLDR